MADENRVRYRKAYPRFWRDEKILRLSPEGKLVAWYCLTGPQSNRCGIFAFSPGAAAEDCGLCNPTPNPPPNPTGNVTPRVNLGFSEAFAEVINSLSWKFDPEVRVLYIPRWWKWNAPDNLNVMKSCLGDLNEVPQCELLQEFRFNVEYLPETLRVTLPQTLPLTRSKPSRTQEQEQEQEQDKEKEEKEVAAPRLSRSSFDAWWKVYPKKSGKEAARKAHIAALKRLGMNGHKREAAEVMLLETVTAYAASPKAKSSYGWNPATWLNQGHWEDDPAVWQRGDDRPVGFKEPPREPNLPYFGEEPGQ